MFGHLEFSAGLLEFEQNVLHDGWFTRDLQVINVFGREANKSSIDVIETKLLINFAGHETTLFTSDLTQRDREGSPSVD